MHRFKKYLGHTFDLCFLIFFILPFFNIHNFFETLTTGYTGLLMSSLLNHVIVVTTGFIAFHYKDYYQSSFVFVCFSALLKKIRSNIDFSVLLGFILIGCFWTFLAIARHHNFLTSWDLSIFVNGLYNLMNGNGYVSNPREIESLLNDHFSPGILLLAPFGSLFGYTYTLLTVQAFLLASSGIALKLLSKQYLGPKSDLNWILPVVFWISLPIRNVNISDFHPVAIELPLFLFAIAFLQMKTNKRRLLGFLFFCLALLMKESAWITGSAISLAWILGAAPKDNQQSMKNIGLLLLPLCSIGFYIVVSTLHGATEGYVHISKYQALGTNLLEILLSPILRSTVFFELFLSAKAIKFFLGLTLPLALFPLFNLRVLPGLIIILSPYFLAQEKLTLMFHYSAEPSVLLYWAIPGAVFILHRFKLVKNLNFPFIILISSFIFYGQTDSARLKATQTSEKNTFLRKEVIKNFKPNLATLSSNALLPHLAESRYFITSKPLVTYRDFRDSTNKPIECVFFDYRLDLWPYSKKKLHHFIETNLLPNGFSREFKCDSINIFSKSDKKCLKKKIKCPL